jgi:hypothetical protein
MFQFAFGLAAANRLKTDFAMNDELLRPAFDLGPWASATRRARRAARFRTAARFRPFPVAKVDNDAEPVAVLDTLADGVHYAGFFQSFDYFEAVQEAVRAAFAPRAHHVEAFLSRYEALSAERYVCCHVRRTDYELNGWVLPISYYRDCLEVVRREADVPIVFVGDDLTAVEAELAGEPGVRFERNDEIVDLQLLTHAAIVVTSNSSFGWWGSWLGRQGRPVYAPRYWLGFNLGTEAPCRAVPSWWRQVEVRSA